MTESTLSPNPSAVQDPGARRRQLFEEAPIAYHEIDAEGVIREVNRAECELLGYPEQELIGRHIWEFVAAEHQRDSRDGIAAKIARRQPLGVREREYRRADGTYLWVEIHEKLIENAEGEVVGIRSALLDITDRRKLEAEGQKQRDWMRFVLRSATKGIVTTDALGNIGFMNPAAEMLTGWRQEEALALPLETVCRIRKDSGEPVDLMSCILAEPAISNPVRRFSIVDRSGGEQDVQWSVTPVFNDDDVIIGATLVIEKR